MRKIVVIIYAILTTHCLGGYDEPISIGFEGWIVDVETVGGYGESRDEVVTRISLSHREHPLSAIAHVPLSNFHTLWHHLEKSPRTKSYRLTEEVDVAGKYVCLSSHNHSLLEPDLAIALVRLWLDTHSNSWTTPKNEELIGEAQGPHHERLQNELRKQSFPPSAEKVLQIEQAVPPKSDRAGG